MDLLLSLSASLLILAVVISTQVSGQGFFQTVPSQQSHNHNGAFGNHMMMTAHHHQMHQRSRQPTCYMRGLCPHPLGVGKLGRQLSPCHAPNSPLVALTSASFRNDLEDNCPHFFNEEGDLLLDDSRVCCDHKMKDSMKILLTFARTIMRNCPSCEYNAKILFCNLFCHPQQQRHSRLLGSVPASNGRDKSVDKVEYYVDRSFAHTLYESCKDVAFAGMNVVDQICGHHGRANCTPELFLTWMGWGATLPIEIEFKVVNGTTTVNDQTTGGLTLSFDPMRPPRAYQCHEAPPERDVCQCKYCSSSCSLLRQP